MIQKLEVRGFCYRTNDAVYFDASRAPHYGELSGLRASALHTRVGAHSRSATVDLRSGNFAVARPETTALNVAELMGRSLGLAHE